MPKKKSETRKKRYILYILLLVFLYPIGLVVTWVFSRWSIRTKIIITLPLILFISLIIGWKYFLRPFQTVGNSMFPVVNYDAYTLVNLLGSGENSAQRGNIVLFYDPKRSTTITYIGRIVGLGGERIMIKENKVYINGEELPEPYLYSFTKTEPGVFLQDELERTIPQDEVAILGDNREESSDSRGFGFIKTYDIIGNVIYTF